jgi:hypothetical protein
MAQDLYHDTKAIELTRKTSRNPPGGGVCHFCARKLQWVRKLNAYVYGSYIEHGIERAVHIDSCGDQTLGERPETIVKTEER